ncbi:MAG: hypothetical protein M3070_04015 [Actinomycetota bacterium]|nr:hypothetical protein [Actinomycetota bacterium]
MHKLVAGLILTISLTAGLATATSAAATTNGPGDTSSASATALFYRNLLGYSRFSQDGSAITVTGLYRGLRPQHAYFTVVYSNGNCDPAQAFPVGPFYTDGKGRGALNTTVTGAAGLVAGTMSMSVRRGDNNSDIDHDKLLGPTDVVAVPGKPRIGLIECQGNPYVVSN